MGNVYVQKRGTVFQYQFEIASVNRERKFINKSGFRTRWHIGIFLSFYRFIPPFSFSSIVFSVIPFSIALMYSVFICSNFPFSVGIFFWNFI